MSDDAAREVPQRREDRWDGSGSDLRTVLVEGVVPSQCRLSIDQWPLTRRRGFDSGVLLAEVGYVEPGLDLTRTSSRVDDSRSTMTKRLACGKVVVCGTATDQVRWQSMRP